LENALVVSNDALWPKVFAGGSKKFVVFIVPQAGEEMEFMIVD